TGRQMSDWNQLPVDGLDAGCLGFADVGGVRTRVWDEGAGPTMVLVHGGLYGSEYSLDSLSLHLEDPSSQRRLVAFDKLGQGYTDNPTDPGAYTFTSAVDHATALIEQLADEPVDLVGHSLGGLLASRLTIERPELVRSLVIVNSGSTAPPHPAFSDD